MPEMNPNFVNWDCSSRSIASDRHDIRHSKFGCLFGSYSEGLEDQVVKETLFFWVFFIFGFGGSTVGTFKYNLLSSSPTL
jgi:hypothetical protein